MSVKETYYHVCFACNCKFHCKWPMYPCPRCGTRSETRVKQEPPWLKPDRFANPFSKDKPRGN